MTTAGQRFYTKSRRSEDEVAEKAATAVLKKQLDFFRSLRAVVVDAHPLQLSPVSDAVRVPFTENFVPVSTAASSAAAALKVIGGGVKIASAAVAAARRRHLTCTLSFRATAATADGTRTLRLRLRGADPIGTTVFLRPDDLTGSQKQTTMLVLPTPSFGEEHIVEAAATSEAVAHVVTMGGDASVVAFSVWDVTAFFSLST